ncbi:hypothetical protein GW17_00032954 [Ensete ventricosum]|nr:hypothetical protein GW17_00032954 [Ensete ventricosum]
MLHGRRSCLGRPWSRSRRPTPRAVACDSCGRGRVTRPFATGGWEPCGLTSAVHPAVGFRNPWEDLFASKNDGPAPRVPLTQPSFPIRDRVGLKMTTVTGSVSDVTEFGGSLQRKQANSAGGMAFASRLLAVNYKIIMEITR